MFVDQRADPLPCAGYQCRMLCPYQFALDDQGCPLCKCRDPCEDLTCPEGLSCVLQDTTCSAAPCPPLPTLLYIFYMLSLHF
ncbi:hypothetical protein HAZT_HAZT010995 [Hyalella azteca]|uniref:Antistasin-like domain-containing protein n=1 Tax=Hyalella azteca TaxID=294128 RepID=A0A6A0GQK8_HYAAZ|nr:hypothetical protein HAZT_HAZT010995 [Hyalella azteca]